MTALYGVIGDPISHSLSPLIHNGWIRRYGLDASYLAMQVPDGELEDTLHTLTNRGARGLNVTLPHKHAALDLSWTQSDTAAAIGAANTLTATSSGGWHADNTDAPGFLRTLEDEGIAVQGKSILVIGAGGAARGVVQALVSAGAKVDVANRTPEKAEALAQSLGAERAFGLEAGLAASKDAAAIVNTASMGYGGDSLALPTGDDRLFYDISYGAAAKAMLTGAAERGWRTLDGLPMLVAQAAFSFKLWFDIEPDTEDALLKCRTALEMAV